MGLTIAVDVDDVTLDLLNIWLRDINRKFKTKLERHEITTWAIHDHVQGAAGPDAVIDPAEVYNLLTQDMYLEVEPIEGALYGVNQLRELGHRVIFVTSTPKGCEGAKLAFLKRHGFLDDKGAYGDGRVYSDYIECHDKSLIQADILIDDRVTNIQDFPGQAILFDRFHNRSFPWKYRAMNWLDVVRLVSDIEVEKRLSEERAEVADAIIADMISGVGKDAPMAVNAAGGKQSHLPYRFDIVDPTVMFVLARILAEGDAKYGTFNWRKIGVNENLNHALCHIFAYLAGDVQDDHLGHAFCRLMFAKSKEYNPDPRGLMEPK